MVGASSGQVAQTAWYHKKNRLDPSEIVKYLFKTITYEIYLNQLLRLDSAQTVKFFSYLPGLTRNYLAQLVS